MLVADGGVATLSILAKATIRPGSSPRANNVSEGSLLKKSILLEVPNLPFRSFRMQWNLFSTSVGGLTQARRLMPRDSAPRYAAVCRAATERSVLQIGLTHRHSQTASD